MVNATFGVGTPGLTRPAPLPRWLVLLQGIVALVFGILLLVYPVGTLAVLVVFLGIYWLINGIFVLASLFSDRTDLWWKMLVSVLGILAGILVTVPNIGDGWRPACRNSALAMMALTAANASRPATMSFGLCSRTRITRPRSVSASTAAARAPRPSGAGIRLGRHWHADRERGTRAAPM